MVACTYILSYHDRTRSLSAPLFMFSTLGAEVMSGGDHQTSGSARRSHYLDLIDLYAARATLAHTRDTRDPALPTVVLVGRSATIGRKVATHSRGLLRSRRWRVATTSIAVLVLCLFIAGSAFANQQYHVQEGDTITSVGERFGADPVAILAASGLDNPEYLYPGQELTIPGIADAGSGTGFVVGTYDVVSGDTISSIAWDLHVNATDLLEMNGLMADDVIYPGQVLYVPEDKASRTEDASPVGRPGRHSSFRRKRGRFRAGRRRQRCLRRSSS